MAAYKKTDAAIAKLSPEEYRVTQESVTERPGTGQRTRHLCRLVSGEPLSHRQTNLSRAVDGRASPSRTSAQT